MTDDAAYTTNVSQIAADLITLFSQFLEDIPVFKVSAEDRQQSTSWLVFRLFLRGIEPETSKFDFTPHFWIDVELFI